MRAVDRRKPKSGSNSNSNSNDNSKGKRGGLTHAAYDVEKLTSDEWAGDRNDKILDLFGKLSILKSKYDLVNEKIIVEIKDENNDDANDDVQGDQDDEHLPRNKDKEKEKEKIQIKEEVEIDMDTGSHGVQNMPSLESGGDDANDIPMSDLFSSHNSNARSNRLRARISTGGVGVANKFGPYRGHHYPGDSPPKSQEPSMGFTPNSSGSARGRGKSGIYVSKRDQLTTSRNRRNRGRGRRVRYVRNAQTSLLNDSSDENNENNNENAISDNVNENDNKENSKDDPLVQALYMDDDLNQIGVGAVSVPASAAPEQAAPAVQDRMKRINKNFEMYRKGEFDVSSDTRPPKQLQEKHLPDSEDIFPIAESSENSDGGNENENENVDALSQGEHSECSSGEDENGNDDNNNENKKSRSSHTKTDLPPFQMKLRNRRGRKQQQQAQQTSRTQKRSDAIESMLNTAVTADSGKIGAKGKGKKKGQKKSSDK